MVEVVRQIPLPLWIEDHTRFWFLDELSAKFVAFLPVWCFLPARNHWKKLPTQSHSVQKPSIPTWACAMVLRWQFSTNLQTWQKTEFYHELGKKHQTWQKCHELGWKPQTWQKLKISLHLNEVNFKSGQRSLLCWLKWPHGKRSMSNSKLKLFNAQHMHEWYLIKCTNLWSSISQTIIITRQCPRWKFLFFDVLTNSLSGSEAKFSITRDPIVNWGQMYSSISKFLLLPVPMAISQTFLS